MNKLSSTKVAEIVAQAPAVIRAQLEEIQSLREKVAHYEKMDKVTKIASQMQTKNLDPETSFDEKVAHLMVVGDLDVYEKAIDLAAPQIKLAALSDSPGNASDAEAAFLAALAE